MKDVRVRTARRTRRAMLAVLFGALGFALLGPLDAAADERAAPAGSARTSAAASAEVDIGGDHFAAGGTLRFSEPVKGDLIAAGGRLEQEAPVGGDALMLGGEIRTRAPVAHSLVAVGGRLFLGSDIGRNLRAAGGQVDLVSPARIGGNASLAGSEVSVRAPVKGALQIAGSRVLLDAAVDGDVQIAAEHIELGSRARIGGALRWRSPNELVRDAAAQVAGGEQRLAWPPADSRPGTAAGREHDESAAGRVAGGLFPAALWTLGLMALAAAALALLPGTTARIENTFLSRWGLSLASGFIVLACVPVAIVIVAVTVIGAPLALLGLLLFLTLLPLGYVAGAAALGRWGLLRFQAAAAERLPWRLTATLLALLALALVGRLPWLGGLAVALVWLAGLGAIVQALLALRERKAPPPAH